MKSKFLIILLIPAWLVSVNASAQTEADYEALTDFLSPDKISALQSKPQQYAQMAYLNRHGYHVSEIGEKTADGIPDISEVVALYPGSPAITLDLATSQNLNLMAYRIETNLEKEIYFKFGSSGKVLVIPPMILSLKAANLHND